jgi:hypothetical protein
VGEVAGTIVGPHPSSIGLVDQSEEPQMRRAELRMCLVESFQELIRVAFVAVHRGIAPIRGRSGADQERITLSNICSIVKQAIDRDDRC